MKYRFNEIHHGNQSSRPAWGAWIEMQMVNLFQVEALNVAPRMGRVD